jgi:glucuronate isomerase
MGLITEDFLLPNRTARRLYHEVAEELPILDYHCHLPPNEVAENARFTNISDIWLGGDHYKWRAMRANGVPERICTGDADPQEKFLAWARTIPRALRNPLYHWTHLELKRVFDCDLLLSEDTAGEIWEITSARMAEPDFTTWNILKQFDVRVLGTTDDPIDSLEHHQAFAHSGHPARMVPTFRPDRAMITDDVKAWNAWIDALAAAAGMAVGSCNEFLAALRSRHDFFHKTGGRLSDHGIEFCPFQPCTEAEAQVVFDTLRAGTSLSPRAAEQWATFVLQHVGRWNSGRGWTMQLHLGAIRNTNQRMFGQLGKDTGFDAMHDEPVVRKLASFLDSLDATDELPKMIFYHVNPTSLYPLATLMACFQDGRTAGKLQLGSAWWHLDSIDGMTGQINALSNVGLLGRFVGMLTDSRSFLSFPRHEYFRRLVCKIVGEEVEAGLLPDDPGLLDLLIRGIAYENARDYLGFPAG